MARTIILGIYFFILMIFTLVLYISYGVVYFFSKKTARKYLFLLIHYWSRHFLSISGIKIYVKGIENLPGTDKICLVSNHQSYLDIPVLLAVVPRLLGFVAKRELAKLPVLNLWMHAMDCVLINRANSSSAVGKIKNRIQRAEQKGRPLVLFPEGTRSKGKKLGRFKSGGLHLVIGSGLVILPVSVNGTYPLLEKEGKLKKGRVTVQIHPPVDKESRTASYNEIARDIRETIQKGLD